MEDRILGGKITRAEEYVKLSHKAAKFNKNKHRTQLQRDDKLSYR
jgi:hypothetical protein